MTSEEWTGPVEDLSRELSLQISREKIQHGHGSLNALHVWWARRPTVLARVAAYLALTEKQAPDLQFLFDLAELAPTPATIARAYADIRDAQWRWTWRESRRDAGGGSDAEIQVPDSPRVLDPFAGGGAIPLEVARLGCQAYASDISPVAYHILRASLEFPSRFNRPTEGEPGTSPRGTWDGLANELQRWAKRVEALVEPKISHLFPLLPDQPSPERYLWFRSIRCTNSACRALFPIQLAVSLGGTPSAGTLRFSTAAGRLASAIESSQVDHSDFRRVAPVCPVCGQEVSPNYPGRAPEAEDPTPVLGALVYKVGGGRSYAAVQPEDSARLAPWTADARRRLDVLLGEDYARLLGSALPPSRAYLAARRAGYQAFRDLFTPRQLLVALEHVASIREVRGEMQATGIGRDRADALTTYLAFFLDYLIERNNLLCGWVPTRGDGDRGFTGLRGLPNVFVERPPRGLVDDWLATVLPAIQQCALVSKAADVRLADAARLPYADETFDAVVTDPPYFDKIQYADLASAYWVWEASILGDATPSIGLGTSIEVEEADSEQEAEVYRQRLLTALHEISRVLKAGRMFVMILTADTKGAFDEYVTLGQRAGFELVAVRILAEPRLPRVSIMASKIQGVTVEDIPTFLLYFRKPFVQVSQSSPRAEPTDLLAAVEAGKPVLYEALAKLIVDQRPEEDLEDILLPGSRGTLIERAMETLGESDPRELLTTYFGKSGLRALVRELSISDDAARGRDPASIVLERFGFSLPSPTTEDGPEQVYQSLRRQCSSIAQATDKTMVRGAFQNGCTAVERLIRLAVWGWARLAFGADRDKRFLELLQTYGDRKDGMYRLDRLAFGHVVLLFRELPDAIALSPAAELIERKFGRPHIYLPKRKPNRLADRLGDLVTLRNKIDHDKDGYFSKSPLGMLRTDCQQALEAAHDLVLDLVKCRAVPRVAVPTHKTVDQWGRVTYLLVFDDQSEVTARFTADLKLGSGYLYFGSDTNPRPVDPLILALEEVGVIS